MSSNAADVILKIEATESDSSSDTKKTLSSSAADELICKNWDN